MITHLSAKRRPALVSFSNLGRLVKSSAAPAALKYQEPAQEITRLVDARPSPRIAVSPVDPSGKRWLAIEYPAGLPPISDLAQPELRIAGLRLNPKTNGPSRSRYFTKLGLQDLAGGKEAAIEGLPGSPRILYVSWSPDARHLAFVNVSSTAEDSGLSLWVVDVADAHARRLPGIALNGVFGKPYEWMPDSQGLMCREVLADRVPIAKTEEAPEGPIVQENLGRVTPAATFEDLLKNPTDEKRFDYYATSQVILVHLDGTSSPVGHPGIIDDASVSPNGSYVLIDELHAPYSYVLPYQLFPERISVLNLSTGSSTLLVDKPLEDTVPNVHDAVAAGPRDHTWRSDAPATLCWVEAGDGGDPRKEVATRDTLFLLSAPFSGAPTKLADLPTRASKAYWSSDGLVLADTERWRDRKRTIFAISPRGDHGPVKVFDGSFEDKYHDPGDPFVQPNASGRPVLATTPDGSSVYFSGLGASPAGDVPFVSVVNVSTGETKRVWSSNAPHLEWANAMIDAASPTVLVSRESPDQSPNYFIKDVAKDTLTQVTFFPSPYGDAAIPRKTVLKYKRSDGVDLSANLYVPTGYKPADGPLPTLIEAYPTEYKTKGAAGQLSGSPYEFPYLGWASPVPFVTQGYAVLEAATIPIVGEGSAEPNDTYVEQLVASASAAIDEGVRVGVVDRGRVAVMGHSYGAFMTVNLLAHSSLFKAGIARSGAYNRTLTPFGFQNEERTYWQAPEVYYKMSPFSYADKIKAPLLLIHGEADNNQGTFPIQSERLYSAIKGNGGTVRFVLLPLEAHSYASRESVLHMFWEMTRWLDTYVKNPAPAPASH